MSFIPLHTGQYVSTKVSQDITRALFLQRIRQK